MTYVKERILATERGSTRSTLWGIYFERGYGPVIRQTTECMIERINECEKEVQKEHQIQHTGAW